MPKIAVFRNLVFFLYAYDLSERLHLHVANNKTGRGKSAKIWLDTTEVFETGSLTSKELKPSSKPTGRPFWGKSNTLRRAKK